MTESNLTESNSIVYTPPKSLIPFLTSESFSSFVIGPVGSGKTSASVLKLAYHAKKMRKQKDGIRRSRAVWIRNTREQLRDTSIPSFLTWFPDGKAGVFLKSEMKFILRFDDVECEVLFRGLDDADDVRRLLSLELSFAVLDEAREINPDVYHALTARLGRYPSMLDGGCQTDSGERNDRLWGATNPPDIGTFWEELFSNPPENTSVTFQPGAFEAGADWLDFLPEGYYENVAQGKTQEWIDVYINAKFGKSLSGTPVHKSFSRSTHVAESRLVFNPLSSSPLIIGMDTALHPAAVIGQMTPRGRLHILHSVHAADMGALRFIREVLKPILASRFGGAKVVAVIDPAGMVRSQTDESTVADILRAEGFVCRAANTNSIAARIAAVDNFLTKTIEGNSAILIDPEYNQELIQALAGKYRYRVKQNGDAEDKPDKQRPWADLADALQYLCLYADGGALMGRQIASNKRREIKLVSSIGWT